MNIRLDLPPTTTPDTVAEVLRHLADYVTDYTRNGGLHVMLGHGPPIPAYIEGLPPRVEAPSHPAANVVNHPPLNTPLSAFTPEMLERLPVGSRFGEGEDSADYGDVEKRADGWVGAGADYPAVNFGSKEWDLTRPLIRVGPEQASEPAPLPDPWPNMLACWVDSAGYTHRRAIESSITNDRGTTRCMAPGLAEAFVWSPDVVSEVRTPDGVTVWKRAVAKVTT